MPSAVLLGKVPPVSQEVSQKVDRFLLAIMTFGPPKIALRCRDTVRPGHAPGGGTPPIVNRDERGGARLVSPLRVSPSG